MIDAMIMFIFCNNIMQFDNKLTDSPCLLGKGTCFDEKTLNTIQKKSTSYTFSSCKNTDKDCIVSKLKEKTKCNDEECVVEKLAENNVIDKNTADDIILKRFKQRGPRNNTNLLSNVDIDGVLTKYSFVFPDFYHHKFQMIDFEEQAKYDNSSLGSFDYAQHINKYSNLGVVINTDKTHGQGIHWFAVFIDFKANPITIEYFNSSGREPPNEIIIWKNNVINKLKNLNNPRNAQFVRVSRTVHQKQNTECGVYALYYIISRLYGVPYKNFDTKGIPDEYMTQFRKVIFR